MKEVIQFDPLVESQVLSMMFAFPEAMASIFRQLYNMHSKDDKSLFGYQDEHRIYEVNLIEGFIVPEA